MSNEHVAARPWSPRIRASANRAALRQCAFVSGGLSGDHAPWLPMVRRETERLQSRRRMRNGGTAERGACTIRKTRGRVSAIA